MWEGEREGEREGGVREGGREVPYGPSVGIET